MTKQEFEDKLLDEYLSNPIKSGREIIMAGAPCESFPQTYTGLGKIDMVLSWFSGLCHSVAEGKVDAHFADRFAQDARLLLTQKQLIKYIRGNLPGCKAANPDAVWLLDEWERLIGPLR